MGRPVHFPAISWPVDFRAMRRPGNDPSTDRLAHHQGTEQLADFRAMGWPVRCRAMGWLVDFRAMGRGTGRRAGRAGSEAPRCASATLACARSAGRGRRRRPGRPLLPPGTGSQRASSYPSAYDHASFVHRGEWRGLAKHRRWRCGAIDTSRPISSRHVWPRCVTAQLHPGASTRQTASGARCRTGGVHGTSECRDQGSRRTSCREVVLCFIPFME